MLNNLANSFKSVESKEDALIKYIQAIRLVEIACEALDTLGIELNKIDEGKGTPILGVSSILNKNLSYITPIETELKNFVLKDVKTKGFKIRNLERLASSHPKTRVKSHLAKIRQVEKLKGNIEKLKKQA